MAPGSPDLSPSCPFEEIDQFISFSWIIDHLLLHPIPEPLMTGAYNYLTGVKFFLATACDPATIHERSPA
jgi:hypothetical protein